ncbi:MAG: hypothetical protein NTX25_19660 [Proteobacteria bacterium]|nr:hypothetical protein [Pseudomonadota bacterium]
MGTRVKALGLGGVMAWYGSVLENNKAALQYARDWDASLYQSLQWASSRRELEH